MHMSQLEYPDEIVVFPNSQKYEFKSEEKIKGYLKEYLKDEHPNRYKGQYNFRSYSRVKNIKLGTLVLFRFSDKIIGSAILSKEAVQLEEEGNQHKGYVILKDIQVLPYPLMIKELEELTEISFHQKGRSYSTGGQTYQRIPESKIRAVVDRLNQILSSDANIPNDQDGMDGGGVPQADSELGTLGELFILSLESERLKGTGKTPKKVMDGKGYDILSWDENGNEIHIEVKTTS